MYWVIFALLNIILPAIAWLIGRMVKADRARIAAAQANLDRANFALAAMNERGVFPVYMQGDPDARSD